MSFSFPPRLLLMRDSSNGFLKGEPLFLTCLTFPEKEKNTRRENHNPHNQNIIVLEKIRMTAAAYPYYVVAAFGRRRRRPFHVTLKRNLLYFSPPHHRACSSSSSPPTAGRNNNFTTGTTFFGTNSFSLPSLLTLTSLLPPSKITVVVPSLSSGEVAAFARKGTSGLRRLLTWDEFKKLSHHEKDCWGEFGVVASFGYLIPKRVIELFPLGILNVHGSLLPRWRGASPVHHAIMAGDRVTGVSIMKIAPHKFDIGGLLHSTTSPPYPIDPHIRTPELRTALADLGATALRHVLTNIDLKSTQPSTQDESSATFAPKITPEMSRIDSWSDVTAAQVYNKFRALGKLRTVYGGRDVAIDDVGLVVCDDDHQHEFSEYFDYYGYRPVVEVVGDENFLKKGTMGSPPGGIIYDKRRNILFVKCGDDGGGWVFVRKVRLGVKWMSAKDFQNGFIGKVKKGQVVQFGGSGEIVKSESDKESSSFVT